MEGFRFIRAPIEAMMRGASQRRSRAIFATQWQAAAPPVEPARPQDGWSALLAANDAPWLRSLGLTDPDMQAVNSAELQLRVRQLGAAVVTTIASTRDALLFTRAGVEPTAATLNALL